MAAKCNFKFEIYFILKVNEHSQPLFYKMAVIKTNCFLLRLRHSTKLLHFLLQNRAYKLSGVAILNILVFDLCQHLHMPIFNKTSKLMSPYILNHAT